MKQLFSQFKSWIITFFSSAVLTVGSIPILWNFVVLAKANLSYQRFIQPTPFSDFLCIFFFASLACDLFIGVLHYRPQIELLSGWIHHIMYMALLLNVMTYKLSNPMALMLILEAPTFLLSLGHIWRPLRNDSLFGAVFFATRILFHSFMIWQFYRNFDQGRYWIFISAVYPLHWYWFSGWLAQQRRLLKNK